MNTVILYSSRFGAAAQCARDLVALLGPEAAAWPVEKAQESPWKSAGRIILGSSIHRGKIGKSLRSFITCHEQELVRKKVGLFLLSGDRETDYFRSNFPGELWTRAKKNDAVAHFGGALDLDKTSPLLRFLLGLKGVKESYSRIDRAAMEDFAAALMEKGLSH